MKRPAIVALLFAVLALVVVGVGLAFVLSRPGPGTLKAAAGSPLAVEGLSWSRIELPAGLQVDALAAEPGRAVVAGRVGEGDLAQSVVVQIDPAERASTVRVVAHTTYGHSARWASVALAGDEIRAIASRAGGAHLIPRWTVWSGRLDSAAHIEEQVQTFETFGGPAAGGLVDIVALAGDGVILGSWESRSSGGLDIALWTPTGDSWERVADPDRLLRSSATREVQASALAPTRRGLIAVGAALDLEAGSVTERAVAWSGASAVGQWRMVALPAAPASSSAEAVACGEVECWVQGQDGEGAALWLMNDRGAVSVPLPVPTSASPHARPMALADGRLWLATGSAESLLVHEPDGWRTASAPPGTVTAVAAAGDRIYAATAVQGRSALWVARAAG